MVLKSFTAVREMQFGFFLLVLERAGCAARLARRAVFLMRYFLILCFLFVLFVGDDN